MKMDIVHKALGAFWAALTDPVVPGARWTSPRFLGRPPLPHAL